MIDLERVEKRYSGFQALHPLDLRVEPGEVFGFLGPNGAGKTTTIRMLSGVLAPTSGTIRIDGLDIVRHPVEARRRIGYIPDRPYLYEKLTAREFLRFVGGIYGLEASVTRRRGDALLADNDLLDRADELIEAYSHGMKQRLVLSAALLHEPRLLIVDEPMVGLDPHGSRRIKDKFREVAASGRTVFLSTHSLDVAQEVCDRVGILYKGRLVALDTVDQLMTGKGGADLEEVFLKITEEDLCERGPRGGSVKRVLALAAAAALVTACGGRRASGKNSFHVDAPAGWERVRAGGANLAWYHSELSAALYADANCASRFEDSPLSDLLDHLSFGVARGQPLSTEARTVDGRDALLKTWQGSLDGVGVRVGALVLKKHDCLYDLVYIAPPASFEDGWASFEQAIASFRTTGGK